MFQALFSRHSSAMSPLSPKFLNTFSERSPAESQLYIDQVFRELAMRQNERLRSPSGLYSLHESRNVVVKAKNRYCDIIPFDRNRVKLLIEPSAAAGGGENWDGRDYINASTLEDPYNLDKHYVVSQGPLPNTIADFWRVVVQKNSRVLVCLTKMVEQNYQKCAQYWPDANGKVTYEAEDRTKVTVENLREKTVKEAGCVKRQLRVSFGERGEDAWEVTQLCFFDWPDHGVPKSLDKILHLIQLTYTTRAQYGVESETTPISVHCSAGCGRTGTFCAIDTGLKLFEAIRLGKIKDDGRDWLVDMVDEFRKQRIGIVQTIPQLLLCYEALLSTAK